MNAHRSAEEVDIAVVGAGAAGIMAAIWAGRTAHRLGHPLRIVALDGAKRLGAKILVAGGGRCNVTHDEVTESAYAGSTREAIGRVLRRFDVARTIGFFRELGVELKREETGKLFPVSDEAMTVLRALLDAAATAGAELRHPWRVERVSGGREGFVVEGAGDAGGPGSVLRAKRLVLATGGRALPKTGSDGLGYSLAKSLGHSVTARVFPALVPLTLPKEHALCSLSGLSAMCTLELRSCTGKRLAAFTDSVLCTHFGLSGPAVLDISRYYSDAAMEAGEKGMPPPVLLVNWIPGLSVDALGQQMIDDARAGMRMGVGRYLRERAASDAGLPERLVEALCDLAGVAPSTGLHELTREQRTRIIRATTELPLPVTGDRGFTHAEVTAGGIPLAELNLKTMESRVMPGLYLCGEICDVDGRIGGFNFQWAWASGHIAGCASAESLWK